jgi:hypothetical protein
MRGDLKYPGSQTSICSLIEVNFCAEFCLLSKKGGSSLWMSDLTTQVSELVYRYTETILYRATPKLFHNKLLTFLNLLVFYECFIRGDIIHFTILK